MESEIRYVVQSRQTTPRYLKSRDREMPGIVDNVLSATLFYNNRFAELLIEHNYLNKDMFDGVEWEVVPYELFWRRA